MDIKFKIYTPEDWGIYKDQLMYIEKTCFSGNLLFSEERIKEQVEDFLCVLVFDGDNLIGNTYISKLDDLTEEDFDGYFDPKTLSDYGDNNSAYVNSTAILPEYEGKGLAVSLKKVSYMILASRGIRYVYGHAHKGAMTHIIEKSGGNIICEAPNWYGTGQTKNLYIINIVGRYVGCDKYPRIIQEKEYTCGPACAKLFCPAVPEVVLEDLLHTTQEKGTKAEMFFLIDKHIHIEKNASISDLTRILRDGCVPIVNYCSLYYPGMGVRVPILNPIPEKYYHYSFCVGIDAYNDVLIYNVEDGMLYLYAEGDFNNMWHSELNGRRVIIW